MKSFGAIPGHIAIWISVVLLASCGGGGTSNPEIATTPSPTATPTPAPSFPPGDRARGKALYESICAQCHAPNPVQDVNGVLGGAGQPQNILNAIEKIARMQFLRGTVSAQDASDLAAYLANP
ncbi:MAG: c-type cytochrome [Burkholderiaceae bacterium]